MSTRYDFPMPHDNVLQEAGCSYKISPPPFAPLTGPAPIDASTLHNVNDSDSDHHSLSGPLIQPSTDYHCSDPRSQRSSLLFSLRDVLSKMRGKSCDIFFWKQSSEQVPASYSFRPQILFGGSKLKRAEKEKRRCSHSPAVSRQTATAVSIYLAAVGRSRGG